MANFLTIKTELTKTDKEIMENISHPITFKAIKFIIKMILQRKVQDLMASQLYFS